MKHFIKNNIFPFTANFLSVSQWIRLTKENMINVFYHTVSDIYLPHINPLYNPKTVKEFKIDIDFLLKHFTPVDINDVFMNVTNEKPIKKPSFHLSFDDGLSEIYTTVAPILEQKGIPATVFVNSDFVDNKALFYRYKAALLIDKILNSKISAQEIEQIQNILNSNSILDNKLIDRILKINYFQQPIIEEIATVLDINFDEYLKNNHPYLTFAEVKMLQNKGFTIGAHSIDHPPLALLSKEEQIRQTVESIKFVQEKFLEKKRFFAFPFSELKVCSELFDYNRFFDISFGISGIKSEYNSKLLNRIDMEKPDLSAKKNIKRCYLTNYLKQRF